MEDPDGNLRINVLGIAGEISQGVVEARQRYVEMARERQFQNQVLQRQTSWNMPPR